jgi:sarcosine oxidase
MWRDLEIEGGVPLLHVTGIVEIGAPDGALIRGTLEASRQHGLPHETLDASALMRRFPAFEVPLDFVGVYQPNGGFVAAEPTIEAHLRLAQAAGATVRLRERVHEIEPKADGVRVFADFGEFEAKRVVVTAGSWLPLLLPALPAPLKVTRQAVGWFAPGDPVLFQASRFPVFMLENGDGLHYGLPPHGGGSIKFARHHHQDEVIDPQAPTRPFERADEALLRHALATFMPAANGPLIAAKACRYTLTPDGDFLIDRLPGHDNVIVASPCSGHGFKFAPVIGEIIADLVTQGETRHDISRFRFRW